MCKYCENDEPYYCQDCGCRLCEDLELGGDDIIAAPYVTSCGDLYCWRCGKRNQADIDAQEAEEGEMYGWREFDLYIPGVVTDEEEGE